MPTTAELRELESPQVATLFVIEGLAHAWTDNWNLAGTDYCGDGRTIHNGLIPPTIRMGTDLLESELEDNRGRIELLDDDTGYLAALFATYVDDVTDLHFSVDPADDLSARTELHGMHVGVEAIGPAGERNRYPFIPGWSTGRQHIGRDRAHPDIPPAPVSSSPVVFEGRRCAIYRVYRDYVTYPDDESQGWRPWAEADRRWFGTLHDAGAVERRKWQLEVSGPESLLRRDIGALASSEGFPVDRTFDISDRNGESITRIAISFETSNNLNLQQWGVVHDDLSVATQEELLTAMGELISNGMAAPASDGSGALEDAGIGARASLSADGTISVRVNGPLEGNDDTMTMRIGAHRDVWLALGFHVELQSPTDASISLNEGVEERTRDDDVRLNSATITYTRGVGDDDPLLHCFFKRWDGAFPAGIEGESPPSSDHWIGSFNTTSRDALGGGDGRTNLGNTKIYKPLFPGGVRTIPGSIGQGIELRLGAGLDPVYHPGQYDAPVAPDPNDSSLGIMVPTLNARANAQGIWMIAGPRFHLGDEQPITEIQFARASWNVFADVPGTISGNYIVVTEWLDPRHFGVARPRMIDGDSWSILQTPSGDNAVRAFPVFRLGYTPPGANIRDAWHIVLQRLLLTTGESSGWTGFGDGATLAIPANDPGEAVVRDAEIATLGLGLPQELVEEPAEWDEVYDSMPAGEYRATFGLMIRPGLEAERLFRGVLKTMGLAWSLRDGRIGIFDPIALVNPTSVDVVITQSNVRSEGNPERDVTRQDIRAYAAVREFVTSFRYSPHSLDFEDKLEQKASDRGSQYRIRGDRWESEAFGFQSVSELFQRQQEMARYFARRHFLIRGYPLLWSTGKDIWPGSRVLITDPQVVSQAGSYGVTAFAGICIAVEEDMGPRGGVRVDLLVQDATAGGLRFLAPMAVSRGYDATNYRVIVRDNWAGLRDWYDVRGFVEPTSISTLGGDADIEGWWIYRESGGAPDWTGTVDSVHEEDGNCYLQLTGPIAGEYLRDRTYVVILRPRASQGAAWVHGLFAVIGDEDGFAATGVRSTRWV